MPPEDLGRIISDPNIPNHRRKELFHSLVKKRTKVINDYMINFLNDYANTVV